jgi:pimeloyl-ACP methyl ester carboxylesterase
MSIDGELAAQADFFRRCRQALEADGIKLSDFTLERTVSDALALMEAVAPQAEWRLLGLSYGSRLALELLRRQPDHVSAAVLDGLFPPERDPVMSLPTLYGEALERLFDACKADAECRGRAGDLRNTLATLAATLDRDPITLQVPLDGEDQAPVALQLTGDRLLDLVFAAQVDTFSLLLRPAARAAAEQGIFDLLIDAVRPVINAGFSPDHRHPVYWSAVCNEAAPNASQEDYLAAAEAGAAMLRPGGWSLDRNLCSEAWAMPDIGDRFRRPVRSSVPVLILSGEFDPVTPHAWARAAARYLRRGHLVEMRGESHGTLFGNTCAATVVRDFMADPGRIDLPLQCQRELSPFFFLDAN